jgi:hypothetical protein
VNTAVTDQNTVSPPFLQPYFLNKCTALCFSISTLALTTKPTLYINVPLPPASHKPEHPECNALQNVHKVNSNILFCQMFKHQSIVLSHILLKFSITSCKQMSKMDTESSTELVVSAERNFYLCSTFLLSPCPKTH